MANSDTLIVVVVVVQRFQQFNTQNTGGEILANQKREKTGTNYNWYHYYELASECQSFYYLSIFLVVIIKTCKLLKLQ